MARANCGGTNCLVPTLIRVGYVSGAHGLRGALRIRLDNPESTLLQRVQQLTLARDGESVKYPIIGVRAAGHGAFKVTLGGVRCAAEAAALRGAIVMVATSLLAPTTEGEFYYFQTVGCEVVTTAGVMVGIIEEVFSNGANDVWVVRDRAAERLVPVIEDVVKSIDVAARQVIIEGVPGLLD
jgi:16S rRNA processing protein RimM